MLDTNLINTLGGEIYNYYIKCCGNEEEGYEVIDVDLEGDVTNKLTENNIEVNKVNIDKLSDKVEDLMSKDYKIYLGNYIVDGVCETVENGIAFVSKKKLY